MAHVQRDRATRDRWREEMWREQRGQCHWCKGQMSERGGPTSTYFPTFEHLVPRAHGGTSRRENLVLAHRGCNVLRGAPEPQRQGGHEDMPTALYEAFKRAGLVSA
mgnify:CR=1 FL=1